MKALFILNDPPYGTERCYNALRLAAATAKADKALVFRAVPGRSHHA